LGVAKDRDTNSDFDRLACMAEEVRSTYLDIGETEWAASPVNWIRQVPSSHKKGAIGESLVMEWARTSGFQVGPRRHRGHDCVIAGADVEVKLSLRWNSGNFAFLSIRDFDFDVAALLAIAPSETYLWMVPKRALWKNALTQRRGVSGKGSKWLSFPAHEPPEWLRRWGGSFAEARLALNDATDYNQQGKVRDQSFPGEAVEPLVDIGF
jgi:hypothetical protein